MTMKKLILTLCLWPGLASAQGIEIDQLQSAAPFQAGTLVSGQGGLDREAWRGTGAKMALSLTDRIPDQTYAGPARNLLRAALLSEGVPPKAADADQSKAFQRSRLNAALSLGEMAAAQSIVSNMPTLSSDQALAADLALLSGDHAGACMIADGVTDERGQPQWASLRAFCHVTRGEIPAAELTTDLLRSGGYEDPFYFNMMRRLGGAPGKPNLKGLSAKPLHIALMSEAALDWPEGERPAVSFARDASTEALDPARRLSALYGAGAALTDAQMTQILESLGRSGTTDGLATGVLFNVDAALEEPAPIAMGQLYDIARFGSGDDQTRAVGEILTRAGKAGAFERFVTLLSPVLDTLPIDGQLYVNPALFARAAVQRRDLSTLQQAFTLLNGQNPALRTRIALAADALGNGFYGGTAGTDIETRLAASSATVKDRAVRDALIAFAMGANLSEESVLLMQGRPDMNNPISAEIIGLRAAARKQSRAETALWAAEILKNGTTALDDNALYEVIAALQSAGLFDHAGWVAASDFMDGLAP